MVNVTRIVGSDLLECFDIDGLRPSGPQVKILPAHEVQYAFGEDQADPLLDALQLHIKFVESRFDQQVDVFLKVLKSDLPLTSADAQFHLGAIREESNEFLVHSRVELLL